MKRALLHSMSRDACCEVLKYCPNFRCMYFARDGHFEAIGRIGSSLQDLVVRVRPSEEWELLKEGIRSCGQIETLKFTQKPGISEPISHQSYEALFSRRMLTLQRLTLTSVPSSR